MTEKPSSISSFRFLCGVNFFSAGIANTALLLLPFISADLGLSLTQAGSLETTRHMIGMIISIPAAYLFSALGGVRVGIGALVLTSIMLAIMSRMNTYETLFLASLAFGVFQKCLAPMGMMMAGYATQKNKGAMLSWFYGMGDIGKMALATGAVFLTAWIGWRSSMLLSALCTITFVLTGTFFYLRQNSDRTTVVSDKKHPSWKQLWRHRPFMLAITLTILDILGSTPVFVFLNFLLLQKGIPPTILGFFPGLFLIGLLSGRWIFGQVTDRYGAGKTFVVLESVMVLLTVGIALVSSIPMILLVCFLLGAVTRGTTPIRQIIVLETVESFGMKPDRAVGTTSVISHAGLAVAPILFGLIGDQWNLQTVYYVSAIISALAILPAIPLLHHTRKHHSPSSLSNTL